MQKKVTFLGDIMCEPILMKAAKKNGEYDFSCVFQNTLGMLKDSDYVIGNLETPLAGEEARYTEGLFSFNTPDSFADAIKNAGINLVLTANNHCIDRGIKGMLRTIEVLDKKGILHTGTYADNGERSEAAYFELGNERCAVISYTYGTNYSANRTKLNEDQKDMINLLRPQEELYFIPKPSSKRTFKQRVINKFLKQFTEEKRYYVRKYLGMTVNTAHQDDSLNEDTAKPYIEKLQKDIALAKSKADIVFFCPHVGGQFNKEPGVFSEFVFEKAIEAGCDAIIASHAHVVQKAVIKNNIPCFYSTGNFSMSPNSVYLLHENLPEYGIAVHIYLNDGAVEKTTFSILKIVEDKKHALSVYPVNELYNTLKDDAQKNKLIDDTAKIYSVVTGKIYNGNPIQQEYDLENGC